MTFMKNMWFLGFIILLLLISNCCSKEEQKNKTNESEPPIEWSFEPKFDSLTNLLIGKWLSVEVYYNNNLLSQTDSLFTLFIDSNGRMLFMNNQLGYYKLYLGNWKLSENKQKIIYSYYSYLLGSTDIITKYDTIEIINVTNNTLLTSQYINYPPDVEMKVKYKRKN